MALGPVSFQRRLRAVDQRVAQDPDRASCGQKGLGAIVTRGSDPRLLGLVETCGQNACVQCSDRTLADQRRGIEARAEHWTSHDLTVLGVTFTPPHQPWHGFHEVRDWLDEALRGLFAGREGQRFRRELGIGPLDKVWEVTHTFEGGAHPHVHALLYLLFKASAADVARLAERLRERWAALMAKTGAPTWVGTKSLGQRGVHVQNIKSPAAAARYLTKSAVRRTRDGALHATGMFRLLEELAGHEDALGKPCYCRDCKRNTAVWRSFADARDPDTLSTDTPVAHAKRYSTRHRFSPARKFNDACTAAGIPSLTRSSDTDRDEGLCRIRYDALRVIKAERAEQRVIEAALTGGILSVRGVVAHCYEGEGKKPEHARLLADIQVTEPPPWTRRFGIGSLSRREAAQH